MTYAYNNQSRKTRNSYRERGGDKPKTNGREPLLLAYTVDESGDDKHWTRVGRMFPHSDGKGFVVLLSALPLDKRIVIREWTPKLRAEA